jgi:hypothetical protein
MGEYEHTIEVLPPENADTPLTNAMPNKPAIGGQLYVPVEFARHLERNYNAANGALQRLIAEYNECVAVRDSWCKAYTDLRRERQYVETCIKNR